MYDSAPSKHIKKGAGKTHHKVQTGGKWCPAAGTHTPSVAAGRQSAGLDDEAETSASDERVVLVLSGQEDMDRKRKAAALQRPANAPAAQASGIAAGGNGQDAFAAFASKYRDVLRFADADEAEAVYSMVALTQAQAPEWPQAKQAGAAAEVPESRAAKRQQVAAAPPAAPACSEGGSSDSSAKSAPHGQQQQGVAAGPYYHQGIMPGMMMGHMMGPQVQGMQGMQGMQPAGDVAGNMGMCVTASMPMAMTPPNFFPGMMGMPPFLPPCAMPPAMMPLMFGSMFGPLPGSPPLMAMAQGGMSIPGMPPMPPAFMPWMVGNGSIAASAAGEPAAGIPVSGPVPAAGGVMLAAAGRASAPATGVPAQPGLGPAASRAGRAAAAATGAGAAQNRPSQQGNKEQSQQQQKQQAKSSAVAASPSPPPAAAATSPAAAAAAPAAAPGVHQQLEQLDVVALKPWVVSHFCEDVYLLLLDVWRPDSPKVRDAIWAWKLHVKAPRPGSNQPDFRAFLVSLFGLEKLLQLTAADRAAAGRAGQQLPVPLALPSLAGGGSGTAASPAAAVVVGAAGSSAADTGLAAGSSRTVGALSPTGMTIVGSATSPHVAGLTVQPQPA